MLGLVVGEIICFVGSAKSLEEKIMVLMFEIFSKCFFENPVLSPLQNQNRDKAIFAVFETGGYSMMKILNNTIPQLVDELLSG